VALFGPFVPWLRAAGGGGRGVARVFRGRGASGDRVSMALGEPSVWGREWSVRTIVAVVVRGNLADGDGGLRGIGGAIIVLVWCGSAGREWPFLGPQWRRCSEAIMHEAGGNKSVGVDCCFLWDPKNRADHGPSSSWSVRSPRRRNNEMVALSLSRPQLTTDAVCPSRHPSSGPVGQVRARNGATRHPIALLGVLPSLYSQTTSLTRFFHATPAPTKPPRIPSHLPYRMPMVIYSERHIKSLNPL